jgi:CheY-like chemotaxis protein
VCEYGRIAKAFKEEASMVTERDTQKKILIVDDNPADVESLDLAINKGTSPYHISTARTVIEFRQKTSKEFFDLILLDINLCGENGVELCRHFKQTANGKGTKVIVISGLMDANFFLYAKDAGADCILSKDQTSECWRTVVEVLLGDDKVRQQTNILIVDDEEELRTMLRNRFESLHYSVVTACDGGEGLLKAIQNEPDVILMDVRMPGINGLDVCSALKKVACTSSIPVILLTAVSGRGLEEMGRRDGAYAYMSKPFSSDQLIQTVEKATESKRLQAAGIRAEFSEPRTFLNALSKQEGAA